MTITLIILAATALLFVSGKVRADLVAFCAMLALMLSGVLTPVEALSSFGDPVVFVIIGLFVVSAGVFRTGLAKMIGSRLIMLAGANELSLYLLIMAVAIFMGVFVTGTGTVALLIPIIVSMSISKNINVSRFLMPLSFAAGIGSTFTMMNASNLIVQRVLAHEGYQGLRFFSLAPMGLIASIIAVLMLWVLSKIFLSGRRYGDSGKKESKSFDELVSEYNLSEKTFFARVRADSPLIGKELRALQITDRYNINIVQVIRKDNSKKSALQLRRRPRLRELAGPATKLNVGDIIEVLGDKADAVNFIEESLLEKVTGEKINTSALGAAEVLLMPTSRLAGVKVKDSGFREKYRVNIIAINRKGEYITENIKDMTMHRGDAILVQGAWPDLLRLDEDYINIVLVGKPMEEAAKMTIDHKAPLAGLILLVMVALMVSEILPTVVAVLLAAVVMIATGCIRNTEEGYGAINWSSVVMIASMMPMAVALHKTGIDTLMANKLIDLLGDKGPLVLLGGLYCCVSLMTFLINGTALTILFAPISWQIAVAAGVSPYPLLVAVAAASNFYYASPFTSTTNVMVMTAGRYRPIDFVKVGLPLQIAIGIVIVLVMPVFFPFK